jgi:Collagen triple helix repeat (20 copies)
MSERGRDGRDGVDGRRGARGARGADGPVGERGAGAYDLACRQGFIGTESAWIESLRGERGAQGERGAEGLEGKAGELGPRGPKGDKGELGDMPRHEWEGTRLRFEQGPDGEEWGDWTDLRGPPGIGGGVGAINLAALINSWDPVGF